MALVRIPEEVDGSRGLDRSEPTSRRGGSNTAVALYPRACDPWVRQRSTAAPATAMLNKYGQVWELTFFSRTAIFFFVYY